MPDPICGAVVASCRCGLPPNHESPHECIDVDRCNGSWEDRFGPFEVFRLPGLSAAGWGPI